MVPDMIVNAATGRQRSHSPLQVEYGLSPLGMRWRYSDSVWTWYMASSMGEGAMPTLPIHFW